MTNPSIQELQAKLQAAAGPEERVDLLNRLAIELRDTDPAKALDVGEQARALAEQHGLQKGLAYSLRTLGAVQLLLLRYQEALGNSLASLKMLEEQNDKPAAIRAMNVIGNIYMRLGDYDKASEYYFSVFRAAPELNDDLMEASSCNSLGNLYVNIGDNKSALDYYTQGLELFDRIGDVKFYDMTLLNVAGIFRAMKDLPRSLEYYQRALGLMEERGDKYNQAVAWNNLGFVHSDLNQHGEARECWQQGLVLARQSNNAEMEINARINLAELLIAEGDPAGAAEQLRAALPLAGSLNAKNSLIQIYRALASVSRHQGDYKAALEHCQKYHEMEKEQINAQKEEKVRGLQISHEVEKAGKEAELYRLQNVELARAYKELEDMAGSYDRLNQANIELVEL
ncbi:MAG: tetratricopeptide repeat protein, partial [Candidatus Edwardsbacteria bacterium]|nr:tetratricopeptide repeat protein [Candidatus Edwardsbacteria bacterium]